MLTNIKQFFEKTKNQTISLYQKLKFFIEDSKRKFQNLYQTNYDTGIYHLEHNHLWDASFRFKIIKRFWPNELKAQYMYAYCLVLQNFNGDAKRLLEEMLQKDPNYTEAKELLERIKNNDTKELVDKYNAKFNKPEQVEQKSDENNK